MLGRPNLYELRNFGVIYVGGGILLLDTYSEIVYTVYSRKETSYRKGETRKMFEHYTPPRVFFSLLARYCVTMAGGMLAILLPILFLVWLTEVIF